MLITTYLALCFSLGSCLSGSSGEIRGVNVNTSSPTWQPQQLFNENDLNYDNEGSVFTNYTQYIVKDEGHFLSNNSWTWEENPDTSSWYWAYYGLLNTQDDTDGFQFVYNLNQDYAVGLDLFTSLQLQQFKGLVSKEQYLVNGVTYWRYWFVYGTFGDRVYCNTQIDFDFWLVNDDYRVTHDVSVSVNLSTPHEVNAPIQTDAGVWQGYRVYRQLIVDAPSYYFGDTLEDDIGYSIKLRFLDMEAIRDYYGDESYFLGYNSGYDQGYHEGYVVGVNYSSTDQGLQFKTLIGTIIDTPILYLRKFFGYEVFGVNIYYALATMISLIVALAVFRLVRAIV